MLTGQLRDYVSLAGTCNFFRHHMTDDFWQVSYAHPLWASLSLTTTEFGPR